MQFINGTWTQGNGAEFASLNPATGEEIWRGRAANAADVAQAVAAAQTAFTAWSGLGLNARLAFITAFKQRIETNKEELAQLIAQETGKILWDARTEAAAVIGKLTFTTDAYAERTGEKSREMPGAQAVLRHRPHGVMAVFGPYNFPAHLPNGHIMPALIAGNTVVFKPSEQTPLVAEWIMKQWEAAGLPAGVLNLVQGERDTGIALAQSPIHGLLFTGSSATGKALHAQFGGRPEVMLALEMGGNNPLIVTGVADIKAAVHETILSAFISSGQRCTCARRLIIIDWPGADEFLKTLVGATQAITVGAASDTPEPFMGPLISNREAQRLLDAQTQLETLGGKVLLRMQQLRDGLPFLSPAIIDVTGVDNVPDVEYFGPLLQVTRVKTAADAIAAANATQYGLSSAIFTDDAELYQQLAPQIHAGLVNWNKQTTGASGSAPFGGVGLSGNHRPAGYYSADYCAYPVASVESPQLALPEKLSPGLKL